MNNEPARTVSTRTIQTTPILRRISWPAVLAGLVIGLAINLCLSLLGIAVGASTVDPLQGDTPGKGIAIGAGIWLLISSLIATYIGARIAAYLSGAERRCDRVLHGLLSWGTATLLTAFLLTSAVGKVVGGAMGVLGQAAGGAASAAAARSDDRASVSGRVNVDVDAAKQAARDAVGATGSQAGQQAGTDQQAKARAEHNAREAGDTAARATSQAAFWSFLMLLLGGIVAAIGGGAARRWVETETIETAPAR